VSELKNSVEANLSKAFIIEAQSEMKWRRISRARKGEERNFHKSILLLFLAESGKLSLCVLFLEALFHLAPTNFMLIGMQSR
jgi:hypothetical protein